jgi:heat shock protein HslJ
MSLPRILVALALSATLVTGCSAQKAPPEPSESNAAASQRDAVRWTIAATLVECVGVGRMTCMQYRDAPGGPWKTHYGPIEGFEFRPGYERDLLVRFVAVPKPPADGSSRRVVLVSEIQRRAEMTDQPTALAGTAWQLVAMPGAATVAGSRGPLSLSFDEGGRASGNSGVNRFGAGFEADATTLRFRGAISTRMAGPPDAMALESLYLARLQQTASWRIEGGRLTLRDERGTELVTFSPALR